MNVTVIITAALMSACVVSARLMGHDWSHNSSHLWNNNVANGRREVARRVQFVPFGLLQTLTGHTRGINSVAFSNDGTRIVSGTYNEIKIWDAQNGGAALLTIRLNYPYSHMINSVAFNNDGTRIVSGGGDRTIKIWDAKNGGAELQTLRGHSEGRFKGVYSVAFNNDGTRIVSGADDSTIKIWDAQIGGAALHTLRGHINHIVYSVAFNNDGTRIVSGSSDGTIKIWDAQNGGAGMQTLIGHEYNV